MVKYAIKSPNGKFYDRKFIINAVKEIKRLGSAFVFEIGQVECIKVIVDFEIETQKIEGGIIVSKVQVEKPTTV